MPSSRESRRVETSAAAAPREDISLAAPGALALRRLGAFLVYTPRTTAYFSCVFPDLRRSTIGDASEYQKVLRLKDIARLRSGGIASD